jgi:hypothetical protein
MMSSMHALGYLSLALRRRAVFDARVGVFEFGFAPARCEFAVLPVNPFCVREKSDQICAVHLLVKSALLPLAQGAHHPVQTHRGELFDRLFHQHFAFSWALVFSAPS